MPPAEREWWAKLGDAVRAWPFWAPRMAAIAGALVAIVLLSDWRDVAWKGPLVVAAMASIILVVFTLRNVLSVVGRRAVAAGTVLALVLVLSGTVAWRWFAGALLLVGVATAARRQITTLSPRFIGVPRADLLGDDAVAGPEVADDGGPLVDAMDTLWGSTRPGGPRHGRRGAHQDGSGARGSFEPAAHQPFPIELFTAGGDFDAVVRFSNFWAFGTRDDSRRTPRGMAIKIRAGPAGNEHQHERPAGFDLVLLDARRFPVNSREDFYGLVPRLRRWPRLVTFWLVDRTRLTALAGLLAIRRPTSYLTRRYHGINTFLWKGEPVRYLAVPRSLPPPPRCDGDPRWRLDRDLRQRLADGPAAFELRLVRGRGLPTRVLLDARRAWPRLMPSWTLGTLQLTVYVEPHDIDAFSFDPLDLPVGVEPSADEILTARRAAHAESRLRRCPI